MARTLVAPENRKYKTPEARRAQIIDAAYARAKGAGLANVTLAGVAADIGVTGPLLNKYIGGVAELRAALVAQAATVGNVDIVADALEMGLDCAVVAPALLARAQAVIDAA